MLSERSKVINNFLALVDVLFAWIALNITLWYFKGSISKFDAIDAVLLHLLVLIVWFVLSKVLRLSELYRSRPNSILLFNCILLSILGPSLLVLLVYVIDQEFIRLKPMVYFAAIDLLLTYVYKFILFSVFKKARSKGLNFRNVLFVGDKSLVPIVNKFSRHKEWGYNIIGVVGDNLGDVLSKSIKVKPKDSDIDKILTEETVDELIYCYEIPEMHDVQNMLMSCNEVGVVFRMYSPVFNMLSNKTHLHFFGTTPLLTISNTPLDYLSLKLKRAIDFSSTLIATIILSPVFVTIAVIIAITSPGPVFFKQIRVGLRGRKFWLYKFRTMVTNAEDLKEDLKKHNEMDGPVFKMTHDPRITKVGRMLRKTGLDELPQFFNVLLGHMSLVGPRPPVPQEVEEYERWQLRRLSMKPGITCIWQISENRNDITFEEWMRMDLEYIDNWSLRLDFVIIIRTVRALLRADGK